MTRLSTFQRFNMGKNFIILHNFKKPIARSIRLIYKSNRIEMKALFITTLLIAGMLTTYTQACTRVVYLGKNGMVVTGRTMDWKEDLKIHSVNGEVYEFNVFSATLGYSRKHIFIYSVGKTEDDFIRCVLETFRRLGGLTQILKTDNMTAIVSLRNGNRKIHSRVQSFFDDLGVKLELCECRTPETKGKCESSNRFVNWLVSFDHRIKNEQELIHIIENQITSECNKEINRRTKVPPAKLFLKEKEFLKPFGNNLNMDTYLREHRRVKVPSMLLVSYNGKQYSVPTKYIGKVVDIYAVGSEVYIYHNSQLITVHTVTECKLNYKHEHYIDALSRRLRTTQDDIEELAMRNLERLENLGGD